MYPANLPAEWRAEAESFQEHGVEPAARAYERCARQLEESLMAEGGERLTLGEAAEESGYSTDHLGRLIREEKIPNAGRANAPRIRRADLPIKPKPRALPVAEATSLPQTTNAQVVQSIIDEGVG